MDHQAREQEALLDMDAAPHSTTPEFSLPPLQAPDTNHESLSTEDINTTCSNSERSKAWSTIWLRKRTLVLFMVLFAAMAASLLVLRAADLSQNGFSLTLGANHYAWTYGPTAILTIVLALWRQVDFHCKILQPWQELGKGPRPADRTLLLDYVGPLNITSLIAAIRHRHYAVVSSIIGLFILKSVILFSTGLLVLEPTLVAHSSPTTISSTFAPGKLWEGRTGLVFHEGGENTYYDVSSLPMHRYLASLYEDPGAQAQTKKNTAYQTFEMPPVHGLESFTLKVDVFRPDIACEIATPSFLTNGSATAVGFQGSTCSALLPHSFDSHDEHEGDGYLYDDLSCAQSSNADCQQPSIGFWAWKVNCSDPASPAIQFGAVLNADTQYDARYGLLVANYTPGNWTSDGHDPQPTSQFYEAAAVLCKIDYTVAKANVTQYTRDEALDIDGISQGGRLQNLTDIMLGDLIVASLATAGEEGLAAASQEFLASEQVIGLRYTLFYFLVRTSKVAGSLDRLLNGTTLRDSAVQVWGGMAHQFMRSMYLQASNTSAEGSGHFPEDRLHVAPLSLWVITAGCAALIMSSLWLLCARPIHLHTPHDPRNISNTAVVLAASPLPNRLLSNHKNFLRTSQLATLLKPYEFRSLNRSGLELLVTRSEMPAPSRKSTKENKRQSLDSWTPLSARLYMAWPTMLVPLVVIATIESLYRLSHRYRGIVDVSDFEDIATALSRIIPALVMFTIATIVNSLDFSIASFAPFSVLRMGGVSTKQGLEFRILGELPPIALWRAAMAGHWPALLSSLAGIIGSVLAIAASGLLVVNSNVSVEVRINTSLAHSWDVNWHNSATSGDGGAGILLNQIQQGSTEMPVSVWNNIVIPQVSSTSEGLGPSTSSQYNQTFDIVALRPELVCELIDKDRVYVDELPHGGGEFLFARPLLQSPCQRGGSNGTKDHLEFIAGNAGNENRGVPFHAIFNDLHLGPWDPSLHVIEYSDSPDSTDDWKALPYNSSFMPDNPAGCPSIGIGLSGQSASEDLDDRFTAFLCSQKVAQLRLRVAYSSNGNGEQQVSTKIAPVVLDGLTHYLTNGTAGIDSFPYRPETYLAANLTRFPAQSLDEVDVDKFFHHLIYGPNGTSIENLIGKANRKNLLGAVQQLYGKYMSLVIDAKFRQPFPAGTPQEDKTVNGTATYFTSRLQVDYGSKLALQILLGTMTLFAALAFGLSDLRGTLPRKPTSIASVMALLAGSDLVQDERLRPENLQGRSVEEVLDGEIFSLGWWPVKDKDDQNGEQRSDEESNSREGNDDGTRETSKRFGIDIGIPEQLGLRETRAWRLRQRLTNIGRRSK